jgi:hypothetical protein
MHPPRWAHFSTFSILSFCCSATQAGRSSSLGAVLFCAFVLQGLTRGLQV